MLLSARFGVSYLSALSANQWSNAGGDLDATTFSAPSETVPANLGALNPGLLFGGGVPPNIPPGLVGERGRQGPGLRRINRYVNINRYDSPDPDDGAITSSSPLLTMTGMGT